MDNVAVATTNPTRHGFTLLELVVALSVMGAVVAVGYGALESIRSHRDRVEAVASIAQHGAAVRRGLRDWLWGARLVADQGGPEFRGIDGVDGGDEDDDLSFLTNAPTPLGPSNTLVHLYVDRDPATPERGLVAELREWHGVRMRRVESSRTPPGFTSGIVRLQCPLHPDSHKTARFIQRDGTGGKL